ncbi:MAG: diaminopimelate epimerase [Rhodospirillaceae bacterium TMED8]|nr:diaminopimelate epimerase [Magnetovibrio sp.]OUT52146.1 MAG: diaminopimelate epimerase [Rhodospirillaceae bacterium TMED8]|tara:strand:- start:3463 stop:4299 length:837 start_codon:yes stop_codon:yes gene_type:complete
MIVIPFIKMHGLGNDFVVIDGRETPFGISSNAAKSIGDRRTGVGCDQILILKPVSDDLADAYMEIWNADGSIARACGNGARCVAALLMSKTNRSSAIIETAAGLVHADSGDDGMITVDMGQASSEWTDIPLSEERDTLHLGIENGPLSDPVGVNIGNPHAVFFVEDADAIDIEVMGPIFENHPLFPDRANIEIVSVLEPNRLRMRVWERGGGLTRACGSGACAAAVAGHRRGLTGRRIEVVLDGGLMSVEWLDNGHVLMTGPAVSVYNGELDSALFYD